MRRAQWPSRRAARRLGSPSRAFSGSIWWSRDRTGIRPGSRCSTREWPARKAAFERGSIRRTSTREGQRKVRRLSAGCRRASELPAAWGRMMDALARLAVSIAVCHAPAISAPSPAAPEPTGSRPTRTICSATRYPRRGLDGDYLEVEYDRPRDLDARDTVRGERVDPKYVSLDTDAVQADRRTKPGRVRSAITPSARSMVAPRRSLFLSTVRHQPRYRRRRLDPRRQFQPHQEPDDAE